MNVPSKALRGKGYSYLKILEAEALASANYTFTCVAVTVLPVPGCLYSRPFTSCRVKGFSSPKGISGDIE